MAQFEVLSVEIDLSTSADEPSPIRLKIDNPMHLELAGPVSHSVPDDVEIVAPGQEPGSEFWVYSNHYHLTLTLRPGKGANPLVVNNLNYFNFGPEPNKMLDVVIEEDKEGQRKTKKVRRASVGTATG